MLTTTLAVPAPAPTEASVPSPGTVIEMGVCAIFCISAVRCVAERVSVFDAAAVKTTCGGGRSLDV